MGRALVVQAVIILSLLAITIAVILSNLLHWDHSVSLTSIIAIPAAVITVSQLVVSNHVQRASYIKDYALRFRSDKELSESFYYLIICYGNTVFEQWKANPDAFIDQQKDLVPDLRFFDPSKMVGAPQERRLDNLIGFFDALGFDYDRRLIRMKDIAGIFPTHLDHFIQRNSVESYIESIKENWPKLRSFHAKYKSPTPFFYFSKMCEDYIEYQKRHNPA